MSCEPLALIATITAFSITDGDTIRWGDERMRLCGIDAPEVARFGRPGEPGGEGATDHLRALTAGRSVQVYATPQGRDRYGRLVVVLGVDGRDLSCTMIAAGHATELPRYSRNRYAGCR